MEIQGTPNEPRWHKVVVVGDFDERLDLGSSLQLLLAHSFRDLKREDDFNRRSAVSERKYSVHEKRTHFTGVTLNASN